jgi:hypothetical protein
MGSPFLRGDALGRLVLVRHVLGRYCVAKASLEGVDAKLGRARTHLQTLYDELNAFLGQSPPPHEVVEHIDREARTFAASLKVVEEPDEAKWGVVLGDFLHNCRSALDHLVCQLVVLSGNKPGRDNQFPIALSGPTYWCARKDGTSSVRDRMLRGVDEELRTAIDLTQPYRGGYAAKDHSLACLADLSNADKHRLIHPTFFAVEQPDPSSFEVLSNDEGAVAHIEFNSGTLEDGATVVKAQFVTTDPNAKVHMKAEIPVFIGFGESRPLTAESLGTHILKAVEAIIDGFRQAFP